MILKFDEFINEAWMERSHYETQHLYGTDPHFKRQVDNGELHFAEGADGKPVKVINGEIFYGRVSRQVHYLKKQGKDELQIEIECFTDNPEYIFGLVNINELAQILIKKEIGWLYVTNKRYKDSWYVSKDKYYNSGKPDDFDEDTLITIKKPLRKTHLFDDVKKMLFNGDMFIKVVVDDVKRKKLSVVDAFNSREEAEKDMIEKLKK